MVACAGGVDAGMYPTTTVITTAGQPEADRFAFWRETVCNTVFLLDCLPNSDRVFLGEKATTQVKEIGFSRIRTQAHNYLRSPAWIRRDSSEVLFVSLILKGRYQIRQDGREAELGPGDLVCFDSTRPYSGSVSDDSEHLYLHMPRATWARKLGPTEQMTARRVSGNTAMGALAANFLRQVAPVIGTVDSAKADRLADLSLTLVTTAFSDLFSAQDCCRSSNRLSLLYRAKTFIEQNLHDPELNPEKIAHALNISESYLRQLFREEHTTISSWLWNKRLDKSRQDLSDPFLAGVSVSQIAFNCGFSAFPHFSRRFKAAFSVTPSEFRHQQLASQRRIA